jgi:hypothetical protein
MSMPKKSKKQIRKMPSQMATPTSAAPGVASGATPSAYAPSMISTGRTSDADFKPDYSDTLKDLKRIGILAGSFIVILIALSFFLH